MFGLGLTEILVILVIFLVLFGAKKLPQIGEGLGKTVKEIRKIRNERKADKGKKEKENQGNLISNLKKEVGIFRVSKKPKRSKKWLIRSKVLQKF